MITTDPDIIGPGARPRVDLAADVRLAGSRMAKHGGDSSHIDTVGVNAAVCRQINLSHLGRHRDGLFDLAGPVNHADGGRRGDAAITRFRGHGRQHADGAPETPAA